MKLSAIVQILHGKVSKHSLKKAGSRLRSLEKILNRHGLFFPPLFYGTLNIDLDEVFATPSDSVFIPARELDSIGEFWNEDWRLVRVDQINGKEMEGYILRAGQKAHPDNVAELITSDLKRLPGFNIYPGARIELRVSTKPFKNEGK